MIKYRININRKSSTNPNLIFILKDFFIKHYEFSFFIDIDFYFLILN